MSKSDKLTARVTEQARNPCEPVGQTDLQSEPDEQMEKIGRVEEQGDGMSESVEQTQRVVE